MKKKDGSVWNISVGWSLFLLNTSKFPLLLSVGFHAFPQFLLVNTLLLFLLLHSKFFVENPALLRWYKRYRVKVKVPNNMLLTAQSGSRVVAVLILNLGYRLAWVVNATPRPLYPWERAMVSIIEEAVWGPGWSGRIWIRQNLSPQPGFEPHLIQLLAIRCAYCAVMAPCCIDS